MAKRGKLDSALIARLQEIIKYGLTWEAVPVQVRVSGDLIRTDCTCLGAAGLFIQPQVGNMLTGTILATDLRQVFFCNIIR